jgi:hypothetical protein
MSGVQPFNDLLRPVQQEDSKAFAIMAVPDQMANSFLCQHRQPPEVTSDLNPADARYGAYYLSVSRLNYGEEQSPALLLLWTKEGTGWKIVAWAVEVRDFRYVPADWRLTLRDYLFLSYSIDPTFSTTDLTPPTEREVGAEQARMLRVRIAGAGM